MSKKINLVNLINKQTYFNFFIKFNRFLNTENYFKLNKKHRYIYGYNFRKFASENRTYIISNPVVWLKIF